MLERKEFAVKLKAIKDSGDPLIYFDGNYLLSFFNEICLLETSFN